MLLSSKTAEALPQIRTSSPRDSHSAINTSRDRGSGLSAEIEVAVLEGGMKRRREISKKRTSAADETPVGTLARGLVVLNVVIDSPQPLSLAEIASQSRLDQSTTLRLLRALEDSKYVVRSPGLKRYLPSPRAIRPLPLLHPIEQFRRDTATVLSDLAEEVGQTVVLALFVGFERLVVDIAQRPGSLSPYYDTWLTGPVHASAVGKSLLLNLDADSRRSLLGPEPFRRFTPSTIVDYAAFEADLRISRERGYAATRNEYRIGLTAIGATISTWSGYSVGCLVVTGHSRSFEEEQRFEQTGAAVRRAADLIPFKANSLRLVEQLSRTRTGHDDATN